MMRETCGRLLVAGLLTVGVGASFLHAQVLDEDKNQKDLAPSGKGIGTLQHPGPQSSKPGPNRVKGGGGNGISYHGGPLILGTTNVYYIWYGWGGNYADTNAGPILNNLATFIAPSPYFHINTTYYDGSGNHVTNGVKFAGYTYDNYSHGTSLSDSDIQAIVANAVGSGPGKLPLDTNGVYFVLTSADVTASSGFCTQYCGWHTYATINGANIKYSFVGNAARCPSACSAQTITPNGDLGADAMASVIVHELEESVTDSNLNAWYDTRGYENADKCAWTFGRTYTTSNGAQANMVLGSLNYLIQQNWVNANGGYCALSY